MANPVGGAPGTPVAFAERHLAILRWAGGHAVDLFQIQFARDGFFIHFPYQPSTLGNLKRVEVDPGTQAQVDLAVQSGVTIHKVKYTHHVDGEAHFSQDRKIYTAIRNAARPLDDSAGHVFSLDIMGVDLFRPSTLPPRYPAVQLSWPHPEPPSALRVAGYWQRISPAPSPGSLVQPVTVSVAEAAFTGEAVAVAPPPTSPLHGYVLGLRASRTGLGDPADPFTLIFSGGFAPNLPNVAERSSFLMLRYRGTATGTTTSVDLPRRDG